MDDESLEPITPMDLGFIAKEASKREQYLLSAAVYYLAGALADGSRELEHLVNLMHRNANEKRERMASRN